MRNPKNYFKFMENVALGKLSSKVVCKDNGVLECMSYVTIEELEIRAKCKITFEENEIVIMQRLINEEVVDICNIRDGRIFYIATFLLDNYKTQEELKLAIYRAVVEFLLYRKNLSLQTEDFECEKELKQILGASENENKISMPENVLWGNCLPEKKVSESYRKHLNAIMNPEWHHVRLATLSNIDINMLDEKKQRYFKIYQELIKTIQDLHKCKTAATYEIRWWRFKQAITDDILYSGTTLYMTRYLDLKISMCNVECGLWASSDEKATGFKKSRRYGHTTLK